jgi:hypothetical protein
VKGVGKDRDDKQVDDKAGKFRIEVVVVANKNIKINNINNINNISNVKVTWKHLTPIEMKDSREV